MRAAVIDEFNIDPGVRELPPPHPGEGEIVVDVECSSVNGMDLFTCNGAIQHMMPYEFPITLGRDFAGTVSAVGAGVSELEVGDQVFGMLVTAHLHGGTFAEWASVPAYCAAKRPPQLDPEHAGALGLAGGAARASVDALGLSPGETVLISGATGGVGTFAIQMAKALGAIVVATAMPEHAEFAESFGADETVDYTSDLFGEVRALHPEGVDCVLHLAGDGVALADLLIPGGRLASTLGVGPEAVAGRDVHASPVMTIPSPSFLEGLANEVVQGELRVPITNRYSLDEAAQAIRDFGASKIGKLGVTI